MGRDLTTVKYAGKSFHNLVVTTNSKLQFFYIWEAKLDPIPC